MSNKEHLELSIEKTMVLNQLNKDAILKVSKKTFDAVNDAVEKLTQEIYEEVRDERLELVYDKIREDFVGELFSVRLIIIVISVQ